MRFSFELATITDAAVLAALHTSVADELTKKYGRGAWSTKTSEKGVLLALRTCRVFVATGHRNHRHVSADDEETVGDRYQLFHEVRPAGVSAGDGRRAVEAASWSRPAMFRQGEADCPGLAGGCNSL